ncbi:Retron-type reverse transcriptase [Bacteroidales bacterium Barb6]|nr:Retron-type reverse transcriptase [Bacteroidales bacterium Barb6]
MSRLDLYAKNELKVRYCFQCCDDIVILSASKEELHLLFEHIKEFAEERLHLTIKDNHQIFSVESRGIDFLGCVIRHDCILVRKRIKQRAARRLHFLRSKSWRFVVAASFWGQAKHANSTSLFYINRYEKS